METKNDNLWDAFALCFGNEKPLFEKPFELNGKIYSTDGYTLLRCDKKDCGFEVVNPEIEIPNCEAVIPTPNIEIPLKIDENIFEQYKTEIVYEFTGQDIKCETCNGYGEVEWEFQHYTKDFDCPKCDGLGLEQQKKKKPTDKKTFDNETFVKINEKYFNVKYFYRLIMIQKLIGGDIFLISNMENYKPALFKVGFCEYLIMPLVYSDFMGENKVIEII